MPLTPRNTPLPAALIILTYSLLSLLHLGHPYAPSTAWESTEKATAIFLDFGEEKDLATLSIYLGNYENRRFTLQTGTGSPICWQSLPDITIKRVYQWNTVRINQKARYLRLTTLNQFTQLNELILQTPQGTLIHLIHHKYIVCSGLQNIL